MEKIYEEEPMHVESILGINPGDIGGTMSRTPRGLQRCPPPPCPHTYIDYTSNLVNTREPQSDKPWFLLSSSLSHATVSSDQADSSVSSGGSHWTTWLLNRFHLPRIRNSTEDDDDPPLPHQHFHRHQHHDDTPKKCHHNPHFHHNHPSPTSHNPFGIIPMPQSSRVRRLLFRGFQAASILIVVICLYTLVDNIMYLTRSSPEGNWTGSSSGPVTNSGITVTPGVPIGEQLRSSWIINSDQFARHASTPHLKLKSQSVMNLRNFRFVLNNASMCQSPLIGPWSSMSHRQPDKVYFMILVHSAPSNFEERQAIRSTWGSVRAIKDWSIRLVFLLGRDGAPNSDFIQRSVNRESEIFGDIVSGNFIDSYRNLTYKHLMGYKWTLDFCPHATFVLKTDDDAFIDIYQLFDFTTRTYGYKPVDTMVCNVYPEGNKPVRALDKKGTKWSVTPDEYPYDMYPKYCGGLAYLTSPDVVHKVYSASSHVRFFWIDDVFVTGIIRELVNVEPFYMNLRYSYEPDEYRKWVEDRQPLHHQRKIPFMIVHVDRGARYATEMTELWRKTTQVWSHELGHSLETTKHSNY